MIRAAFRRDVSSLWSSLTQNDSIRAVQTLCTCLCHSYDLKAEEDIRSIFPLHVRHQRRPRDNVLFSCTPPYRLFSTSSATKPDPSISLINLVKPFLLKCHPDVHPAASSKRINLLAVQSLNSYIDTVDAAVSNINKATNLSASKQLIEIDFVISVDPPSAAKSAKPSTSRRKVELTLPPFDSLRQQSSNVKHRIQRHAAKELIKLLRVAGLDPPALDFDEIDDENDVSIYEYFGFGNNESAGGSSTRNNPLGRPHFDHTRRPKTRYELNREKFTSKINWSKYNELYKEAVADMEADIATEGSVSKYSHRRRRLIASILANVTLMEELDDMDQLIAFRRLSLLLDQHFEKLHMEDFGRYWETCRIILGAPRGINVSASALHKRKIKSGGGEGSGFSFTLHTDYSVTMVVPVDFRDDELIQELEANLWDFYNIVGDGLDDIFASG
ncbi:hypothetical protein MPSEU_000191200 [Mayamaea pseudoterrestris]|nr:hypothetical protein MPSEU_000191200 [Mayamaea pseudoterrestris]